MQICNDKLVTVSFTTSSMLTCAIFVFSIQYDDSDNTVAKVSVSSSWIDQLLSKSPK